MNFWQYIDAHPWWTLIFLVICGEILVESLKAIFKRRVP